MENPHYSDSKLSLTIWSEKKKKFFTTSEKVIPLPFSLDFSPFKPLSIIKILFYYYHLAHSSVSQSGSFKTAFLGEGVLLYTNFNGKFLFFWACQCHTSKGVCRESRHLQLSFLSPSEPSSCDTMVPLWEIVLAKQGFDRVMLARVLLWFTNSFLLINLSLRHWKQSKNRHGHLCKVYF